MSSAIRLLLIALSLSACSKASPKWIEIGKYPGESVFYVEKHVEVGSPNTPYMAINTLWDYQVDKSGKDGKAYRSEELKLLIDCKRQLVADFSVIRYAGQMASGAVIESEQRVLEEAYKDLHAVSSDAVNAISDWTCESMGKNKAWSSR